MDIIYKWIFVLLFILLAMFLGIVWNDSNLLRKIIFGLSCAFIIVILDGFFLAYFKLFCLLKLILFISLENIIIAIIALRHKKIEKIYFRWDMFILFITVLGSILLLMFPSTDIFGGRDEGLYFMEGVHIAQTGRLDFERDQYLVENYENIFGWCELGYLGVYSKYYFNTSDSYGDHEFQFMPLLPISLAVGYLLGGIPLLIRINGIIGIFTLLVIYCFINDYIGNKYQSFFSCVLILLSPAFLWNARGTFSETLAQFIMFLALYILCKAWAEYKYVYWIISGILIGITSIVRIDAFVCGIGFLFALILMIYWDSSRFKYYFSISFSYFVTIFLCILYGYQNSYSYIFEHKHLLIPLVVIQIILLGILVFLFFLIKKKRNLFFNSGVLYNQTFQNCFIGLYWIFIFVLLFIRPDIEGDSFATRAAKEFSWYTSIFAVFYFPIGIKHIINKNKKHIISLLPFLCISGSIYLLYIYNPSISQDHIWCSRRWVFMSISFVMICFVQSLGELRSGLKKNYGLILIATVICYLLCQDKSFLTVSMYKNLNNEYEKLAKNMTNDEVYFTADSKLATTLRFIYNRSVYYIDISHGIISGRTTDVLYELSNYMKETNNQIYFIGDISVLDEADITYEIIFEYTISTIDLERSIAEFPRKTSQLNIPANIYVLSSGLD